VLRHLPQDGRLVGELVQDPPPAAEGGGRDLADNGQYAGVAPVATGQRRAGVEETGPGHDRERRRPAGDLRRADRHVRRALLVTGHDRPDVPGVHEPVEEVVVLHAGQAEQRVDAQPPERIDDEIGDGARGALGHDGHV
jgi:hypothetical protein